MPRRPLRTQLDHCEDRMTVLHGYCVNPPGAHGYCSLCPHQWTGTFGQPLICGCACHQETEPN